MDGPLTGQHSSWFVRNPSKMALENWNIMQEILNYLWCLYPSNFTWRLCMQPEPPTEYMLDVSHIWELDRDITTWCLMITVDWAQAKYSIICFKNFSCIAYWWAKSLNITSEMSEEMDLDLYKNFGWCNVGKCIKYISDQYLKVVLLWIKIRMLLRFVIE